MATSQRNFQALAAQLLGRSKILLEAWLPNGKWNGQEYKVGNLAGEPGTSLSINSHTGRWADFASGEKGGDLVSLYAAINRVDQAKAYDELADDVTVQTVVRDTPTDIEVGLPPKEAAIPTFKHRRHGKASAHWCYRNAAGRPAFYVARYDLADGSKEVIPWSWSLKTNKWVTKSFPPPRLLYRLDKLTEFPRAPVMIVEGEKAADAAQMIVGERYVVTTWQGGTNAVSKTDFTHLNGRKVLLWPDSDRQLATEANAKRAGVEVGEELPYHLQPGPKAMRVIAGILKPICPEVKMLAVDGMPDTWDAADAHKSGWDWNKLRDWAGKRAKVFQGGDVVNYNEKKQEREDNTIPEHKQAEARSVFEIWDDLGLAVNNRGIPYANEDNVLRILERHEDFKGTIWFDEFHSSYFYRNPKGVVSVWSEDNGLSFTAMLQRDFGLRNIKDTQVKKAIRIYAKRNVRNEVVDYLESLEWDKTSRLDSFFADAMNTGNNEYTQAVGRNFWIAIVARTYDPGCQYDNMVVLEGPQGIYKSSALRAIGGKWYTESHESVKNKDFYLTIQGKLIVEIGEMDSFSKAEASTIKRVITQRTDRFRIPYDAEAKDHPRRCVFTGTTNESEYLRDVTGGRRTWPISCQNMINLDYITDNRDQLFAEAVYRYKSKEPWHVTPEAETKRQQELRREADEWETLFAEWLEGRAKVEIHEVLAEAVGVKKEKQDLMMQRRAGRVLRSLGWERTVVRRLGVPIRLWINNDNEGATPDLIEDDPI